jgi:molybdopterin converting factor small subunit
MAILRPVETVCGPEGLPSAFRRNEMNIRVKLFATLREGRGKEVTIEVCENAKVYEILDSLKIDIKDVAILLVNGRDGKPEQGLNENDLLSVFPPVGGG